MSIPFSREQIPPQVLPELLNAIIALSFSFYVSADWFTNPPSFEKPELDATDNQKLLDLSTTFTLGETVVISWNVPFSTVPYISLRLHHFDVRSDIVLHVFISNEPNEGSYTWTIGDNDSITEEELAVSPNFGFGLLDVSGTHTSTGNPPGFVDHTLSSRGFVIKSNRTASTSTSISVSSASEPSTTKSSTTESSTTESPPTESSTTTSAISNTISTLSSLAASPTQSTATTSSSGHTTGDKVAIALGAFGALLVGLLLYLYFQYRSQQKQRPQDSNFERFIGLKPELEGKGVASIVPQRDVHTAELADNSPETPTGELNRVIDVA
ncbi:hypothetical protein GJ744_002308 [Endocarpon pusillum]|uniref:Mid2 domain-containing protein n=1 Tax=Endocarpon pusillum TaxID=364733 RepID=A0A8H7AS19_9EURO|nr:hypothetical protein GJ744_002308 [Endocarpon pusillum]